MASEENQLQRSLNLFQVVFYGTGTILGAGIYALIGKVAGASGVLAPLSFLVSAILAGFTAYSFSILVRRYPHSAGGAEYIYHGFKSSKLSNIAGWLIALTGIISAATLSSGFVGYFQSLFDVNAAVIVLGMMGVMTFVSIIGINQSAWLIVLITLVELIGLLLICSAGFDSLVQKDFLQQEILSELSLDNFTPVLSGAFIAFYAFIGFEDIVHLAEETKSPQKNIPRAVVIALAIATVFYLIVALVALAALPIEELQNSSAPLAEMYSRFGGSAVVMSVIGLIAIVNGVLAQLIMASRTLYGLRHPFKFLNILSKVNPRTKTPVIATLVVSFVIIALTLAFPIERLAGMTSFVILSVFSLINLSLVLLELREQRKKLLNIIIPSLATLLNLGFLVFKIMN